MKLTSILFAGILALPIAASNGATLSDDAKGTWETTKHVASRTGQTVETGAVKTGKFVERGIEKTGSIVERGISPVTDRLRGDRAPMVTLNDSQISTPGTIRPGSDLIVRNRGDRSERFEIKGRHLEDHTFLKPGQSKRLNLDLPAGNYEVISSDGGMSNLRVR